MAAAVPEAGDGRLLSNLVLFGRLLRRLGLPVTGSDTALAARALERLDVGRRGEVKEGLAAVLVGRREHREAFDRAFEAFWRAEVADPPKRVDLGRLLRRGRQREQRSLLGLAAGDPERREGPERGERVAEPRRAASGKEVLRRKDFAELTAEEEAAVRALILARPLRLSPRRTRRLRPAPRGRGLDLPRTLRRSLARGGEPLELVCRRRRTKPRPLVALCDISGSMEPYSRLLLELLYTLGPGARARSGAAGGGAGEGRREIFAFGTRLTRLTREMDRRDPGRALKAAAAAVADWGGGTRIGEALRTFNLHWARRVLGRGAVVLLISDGWERGSTDLLARETARLQRSCDRLIWLNPRIGAPGFEPLAGGLVAALPYVDDFLPVHNLVSLEQLAQTLSTR